MSEDPMSLLPEDDEMSDDLIEKGVEAVFQLGLRLNREEARAVFVAALAAIETSGTHWCVSVDLGLEMIRAAEEAYGGGYVDQDMYTAMLSAAPKLGGET